MLKMRFLIIPVLIAGLFLSCDDLSSVGTGTGADSTTQAAAESATDEAMDVAMSIASTFKVSTGASLASGVSRTTYTDSESHDLGDGLSMTYSFVISYDDTTSEYSYTYDIDMTFDNYVSGDVTMNGTINYDMDMDSSGDSTGIMTGTISVVYDGNTYSLIMNLVDTTTYNESTGTYTCVTTGTITCAGSTITISETYSD